MVFDEPQGFLPQGAIAYHREAKGLVFQQKRRIEEDLDPFAGNKAPDPQGRNALSRSSPFSRWRGKEAVVEHRIHQELRFISGVARQMRTGCRPGLPVRAINKRGPGHRPFEMRVEAIEQCAYE